MVFHAWYPQHLFAWTENTAKDVLLSTDSQASRCHHSPRVYCSCFLFSIRALKQNAQQHLVRHTSFPILLPFHFESERRLKLTF